MFVIIKVMGLKLEAPKQYTRFVIIGYGTQG